MYSFFPGNDSCMLFFHLPHASIFLAAGLNKSMENQWPDLRRVQKLERVCVNHSHFWGRKVQKLELPDFIAFYGFGGFASFGLLVLIVLSNDSFASTMKKKAYHFCIDLLLLIVERFFLFCHCDGDITKNS